MVLDRRHHIIRRFPFLHSDQRHEYSTRYWPSTLLLVSMSIHLIFLPSSHVAREAYLEARFYDRPLPTETCKCELESLLPGRPFYPRSLLRCLCIPCCTVISLLQHCIAFTLKHRRNIIFFLRQKSTYTHTRARRDRGGEVKFEMSY